MNGEPLNGPDQALLRTLASGALHVIVASDLPDSADGDTMQDLTAFLDQASRLGRELAATFQTADGKLAVVLRRRPTLVEAAPQMPPLGQGPGIAKG